MWGKNQQKLYKDEVYKTLQPDKIVIGAWNSRYSSMGKHLCYRNVGYIKKQVNMKFMNVNMCYKIGDYLMNISFLILNENIL